MRMIKPVLAALLVFAPIAVHAQDQSSQSQSPQGSQGQSPQDVFSYSYLQVNRLSEHSDFFNDRSAGNGLKFSYDFPDEVYLFGQWDRLNFDTLPGHHDLTGVGIGTHQAYSRQLSFFIDLAYLRDRLSGGLGGLADNYWRVSYGFRGRLVDFLELDGAIFTERNTDFGRRPFGERLGLGIGSNSVGVNLSGEHTADGNRIQLSVSWYYR
ncbi:MAG: hypothetical protein KGJ08_05165 [Gammaproteobacteria bacterium]|nr:hypothetical protein [Gammaproteobacteria bacterium]